MTCDYDFFEASSINILDVFFPCEPLHDKTNKMTRAPSDDSDQPGHPPSLFNLHCSFYG